MMTDKLVAVSQDRDTVTERQRNNF